MKMQESGENYLETILILEQKNGSVRSIDIATTLGYSKPSVSRAMGILKQAGYITMEKNGDIQLSVTGREIACHIYERHRLISDYLVGALGIERKTADLDACRIEHIISQESFDRIKEWVSQTDQKNTDRLESEGSLKLWPK